MLDIEWKYSGDEVPIKLRAGNSKRILELFNQLSPEDSQKLKDQVAQMSADQLRFAAAQPEPPPPYSRDRVVNTYAGAFQIVLLLGFIDDPDRVFIAVLIMKDEFDDCMVEVFKQDSWFTIIDNPNDKSELN